MEPISSGRHENRAALLFSCRKRIWPGGDGNKSNDRALPMTMLVLSILALSFAVFLILAARAPRGSQDEGGFHHGRHDEPPGGKPGS